MKTYSIFETMKSALIGKELKYVSKHIQITQDYYILKKKSANVTNKQFETGSPKFCNTLKRTKNIGKHTIYETSKIVDIMVEYGDWDDSNSLELILENGYRTNLEVDTTIQEIDENTIMLKY